MTKPIRRICVRVLKRWTREPRYKKPERFGVSVSSAVRWHQAWQHEGTIEAKPYGGSRSPLEDHARRFSPSSRNSRT